MVKRRNSDNPSFICDLPGCGFKSFAKEAGPTPTFIRIAKFVGPIFTVPIVGETVKTRIQRKILVSCFLLIFTWII
jgi:hypothetical protein